MSASKFNTQITELVGKLEKKARTTDERTMIYRLKNRIATALSYDKSALIAAAAPVFVDFSDHILVETKTERDKFFLTFDARAEYTTRRAAAGGEPADDEYIFSLIDVIRSKYASSTPAEQDATYASVRALLAESADYLIEINKSSTKDSSS